MDERSWEDGHLDVEACGETVGDEELAQLCRLRAGTYALLSRLYLREVDESLLDDLRASLFPAGTCDASMNRGCELIAGYLDEAWENTCPELAVDYARVFLGSGYDGHSAAYPYESVHTSEGRLLMQEAYAQVLAAYRADGIVKAPGTNEIADHAGLEFEYLQMLCQRSAEALDRGDEDAAWGSFERQRAFVDDHLAVWIPRLAREMERFAQTDFYRGLAAYSEGFVRSEQRLLNELSPQDGPCDPVFASGRG